jgi:hypothetical protein
VGLKAEGNIDRHSIKRKSGSRTQRDGCKNKHTNYRSHNFLPSIKHLEFLFIPISKKKGISSEIGFKVKIGKTVGIPLALSGLPSSLCSIPWNSLFSGGGLGNPAEA